MFVSYYDAVALLVGASTLIGIDILLHGADEGCVFAVMVLEASIV
ncbi:MAG: hypothetical protein ACYDHP_11040 [Ferrimicrobium sp.]